MQLLQMFHKLIPTEHLFCGLKRLRRGLLLGLSVALIGSLTACGQTEDESRTARRTIAQTQAIASDFLRTELALSPEMASRLGLERDLGPSAMFALDNHSQAGFERRRLVRIELLQSLQSRPRLPSGHSLARDLDVAERALTDLISLEQLGYGRFGYAALRPYAIDPYSGIWIDGPSLLAYRQSINSGEQAAAYLARMRALSAALQDTKRRLIADRASGIVLPRVLTLETRNRMARLIEDQSTGLNRLPETFNALILNVSDLDDERREQLVELVRLEFSGRLRPAYEALIAELDTAAEAAPDRSGIWAQPRGQDLFNGIMTAALGEPVSTERLHDGHLDVAAAAQQALSQLMDLDPDQSEQFAPKPERLSQQFAWFETTLGGAAGPSSEPTPADTLLDLAPRPEAMRIARDASFSAQTEAMQQFQSVLDVQPYQEWQANGDLAPLRQVTEYPAIVLAWKHYVWDRTAPETEVQIEAEPEDEVETGVDLDTEGETETDPMQAIAHQSVGLVQFTLAAADTGIHLNRWTIAEATDYIAVHTGLNEPLSRQLALTIAAKPGFQSSVATARHRFDALSERARAVLGEQYSETDFQRTLIEPGPRPMPLIERDIETWYGQRLAAQSAN